MSFGSSYFWQKKFGFNNVKKIFLSLSWILIDAPTRVLSIIIESTLHRDSMSQAIFRPYSKF